MTNIGDLNSALIQAQNIQLLVSGTAGNAGDDRLFKMVDVRLRKQHERARVDFGGDKDYGHASPDITLTATIYITSDVVDYLNERGTRNSRNILPVYGYRIIFTPNTGGTVVADIQGQLEVLDMLKPRGAVAEAGEAYIEVLLKDADDITITEN